jgi:hypothetical protein
MERADAVKYIQTEAFWAFTSFFDKYSELAEDLMQAPGERYNAERIKSVQLERKAMQVSHNQKLHASTVAQLAYNGMEHCEKIMPSERHAYHQCIREMLEQLKRDAKFFRDQFLLPDDRMFTQFKQTA